MIRLLGHTIILLTFFSLCVFPQEGNEQEIQTQLKQVVPKGLDFNSVLCVGRCVPTVKDLKVGDISPNELAGYRFFAEGKLKNIRLGISTREDMKKLFGSTCEGVSSYDDNWNIWVNYFEKVLPDTRPKPKGSENVIYRTLQPKENFLGTLRFIRLIPKKNISFAKVVFPESFGSHTSYAIGDSWDLDGFKGAVHTESQDYEDGYGLTYSVFLRETFNNLSKRERGKPAKKGTLNYIEYEIPKSLESTVFNVTER